MAEWCCPSCAAAAGAPALYPPGPDVYCATCGRPLDAQERLATAVSELVRQLPRIGAPSANDETCSVPEAAKLFHTTPDSVYAMHSRGQLPETIGPGRRLVWRKSDLLECSAKRVSSPGRRTRR
jgi:predicted DNA-binding transcriptional regulator AlpA